MKPRGEGLARGRTHLWQHRVTVNAATKAALLATMLLLVAAATANARTAGYTPCPEGG